MGRLIPAATVLMALLGIAALVLFGARDRANLGVETVAASLARMNVLLQQRQTDYLQQGHDSGLLEHFWSLSLEWQFYGAALLAIALAYVGFRLARKRSTSVLVLTLLVGATGLSLFLSIVLSPAEPVPAYLAFTTRFWEFGSGALTWFALVSMGSGRRLTSVAGSLAGIILILTAGSVFGTDQPYPGFLGLVPVAGTVLLIAFTGNAVSRVLAHPTFQFIGDRSYSWYLWHWPFLVIWTMYLGQPTWPVALAVCAIALAVAHLSYAAVESPARDWASRAGIRTAVGALILCVVATVSLGVLLERVAAQEILQENAIAASVAAETGVLPAADAIQAEASLPRTYQEGCHADVPQVMPNDCVYGDPTSDQVVYLWGDSQAAQWFPALEEAAERNHWRLLVRTKSSCPPILRGDIWLPTEKRVYGECLKWNRNVRREVTHARGNTLVLLAAFGSYRVTDGAATPLNASDSAARLEQSATSDVLGLSAQGLRTSAFEETFASPRPPPDCIARLGADGCAFMPPSAPTDLFRQVPLTGPLIKTRFLQCPESPCEVVQEGTITMRDDVHLTAAFAASLWEPIGREVARRMTL